MKKLIILILLLSLCLTLCACKKAEEKQDEPASGSDDAPAVSVTDTDKSGLALLTGISLSAPAKAVDIGYAVITHGTSETARVKYSLGGSDYELRATKSDDSALTDISGFDGLWSETSDTQVEGCPARVRLTADGKGSVTWYESASSLLYSLYTGKDASADSLVSAAENVFVPTPVSTTPEPVSGGAETAAGTAGSGTGGTTEPDSGTPAVVTVDSELTAILQDISDNYHPATAGSSLTAARLAGQILDWYASSSKDPGEVVTTASAFSDSLDSEKAALFGEQLDAVYDSATYVCSDSGWDLLDDAGYKPRHWPWDSAEMETVFAAIYSGTHNTYTSEYSDEVEGGITPIEDETAKFIVGFAKNLEGAPYEYGAAGPDKFDNSGFVYYCFRENGVDIPRRTSEMYAGGQEIAEADLMPGDLVFYDFSGGGTATYVGIYVGSGSFIAENNENNPVNIYNMSYDYFSGAYLGARRYW